jgi:hypothetical protein
LTFRKGLWTTFDFNDSNGVSNDIFQAKLSTTNGPSVYKLENIDPCALEAVPSETIEVSLGSLTPEDINGLFDYASFDFSGMLPQSTDAFEADPSFTCPTDFILDGPTLNDISFPNVSVNETPAMGTELFSIAAAASGPYILIAPFF